MYLMIEDHAGNAQNPVRSLLHCLAGAVRTPNDKRQACARVPSLRHKHTCQGHGPWTISRHMLTEFVMSMHSDEVHLRVSRCLTLGQSASTRKEHLTSVLHDVPVL